MTPPRRCSLLLAGIAVIALTACNGGDALSAEEAQADWCDRTEDWMVAFFDLQLRHEGDAAAVGEDDLEELEERREAMVADPVPDEVAPAAETLRDVDGLAAEPWSATETVQAASEELLTYAVETCDLDVEELLPG